MLRLEVQQIDNENLRINLYSVDSASPPLKEYRSLKAYQLDALSDELLRQIPQSFLTRGQSVQLLEKLKKKGLAAFQAIFGETGVKLRELADLEDPQNLIISVDESIAHLPFDILYTGDIFLWQGFIISRQIATERGTARQSAEPRPGDKLVLIGDPSGDPDLDHSIRDELLTLAEDLQDEFELEGPHFGKSVSRQFLLESLSSSNMLHFSGHFSADSSGNSGWLLNGDEVFSGDGLGNYRHLPQFIFSNTCGAPNSAQFNGFIRKFLDAGVSVFLTTNGEVPSIQAAWFGIFFYRSLRKGYTFGQAVHRARSSLIDRFGLSDLSWIFYLLYGSAEARPVSGRRQRSFALKSLRKYALPVLIGGLLLSASFLLFQRYQTGKYFLRTKPASATVYLNGSHVGSTPLALRAHPHDQISIAHTDTDTLRLQVENTEAGWRLQTQTDIQGIITEKEILLIPAHYESNAEIILVPSELNIIEFHLGDTTNAELLIQGCDVRFGGQTIILASDQNRYRYIMKLGGKVYDNAFSTRQDTILSASDIIDSWLVGRYH